MKTDENGIIVPGRPGLKARLSRKAAELEFLPLFAAVAIACIVAGLSLVDSWLLAKAREQALRSAEIVEHADGLLSSLKDAETGQRGFLLTGKDAYLDPYRQALSTVAREYTALEAMAAESADEHQLVHLKRAVDQKLAELQQTIRIRSAQGLPPALDIVQTDQGKLLMDQIREQLTGLINAEKKSWRDREGQMERSASALRWVSVLGSLILVGFLMAAQSRLRAATVKRMRVISDLKTSREETAAARDLFETTLQSIGDAVIATDAEGRVTFINPIAQHLTGWTRQSAIGVPLHRVFRIVNETTRESVENPVEKVIRSGFIVGLANHTILITLDGREIPIDDSAAPIRLAGQEMIGTVLVFRDISERRRAERESQKGRLDLERSNAKLQQMNADLELFSYAAGHDLHEPLRTVAAFSELIARRLQDNPETAQHIQLIQSAAIRMGALVDSLLSYSTLIRDGEIEKTKVRVEEIVGEVLLNCKTAIEESRAAIRAGSLPVVTANRPQMVQLFQNLVSNAIKYRGARAPEIQISAEVSNSDNWLFTVRDNGVGFDMRHAEDVFRAFRRLHTKDQYPGTGLGLAMCKRIVELHAGNIWVESEPGRGSAFRFTLPNGSSLPGPRIARAVEIDGCSPAGNRPVDALAYSRGDSFYDQETPPAASDG